jgi:protein phosphatase
LAQVTTDQTMAQLLVEEGRITADEARSHPYSKLLDQCVGGPQCDPVIGSIRIKRGDLLMLTTDGLHDALSQQVLTKRLAEPEASVEDKADSLLQAALEAGGKDNITLVLAQL